VGQIAVVFLIVLLTTWARRNMSHGASAFRHSSARPGSLFGLADLLSAGLLLVVVFLRRLRAEVFVKGGMIAASGGFIAIAVAIGMSVWRAREAKARDLRLGPLGRKDEVKAAGLLGPDGVVLGRYDRDYLRHDGPEHVLCFAPTRSGKGVGLVVPSLLTWPGSAIVHDIKGENWQLTAGFRARHGRVLLFDPTNPKSSAYNPLLEVRRGEWEVRDVQNIADILVDPEGSLERNHWEKTSHAGRRDPACPLCRGRQDIGRRRRLPVRSEAPDRVDARRDDEDRHLGEAGPHPVIASAARELLNKSDNERSGVLSTAMSFLGLYRDPVVAEVTRRCDWRIADMVGGKLPTTLYLVVPPSDINRTKPLIRLILNQVGRRLTEDLQAKAGRHRLLLMLDEFPRSAASISSRARWPSWRATASRAS
jgi:type IV secretion system protein VirD4